MCAGFRTLEAEIQAHPYPLGSAHLDAAGVSIAVGWNFAQKMVSEPLPASDYPALAEFSSIVEQLPEFKNAPHGLGTYVQAD
jgi:hypothetical protein